MFTPQPWNTYTVDSIRKVKLKPIENAGGYWQGVPHGELIDAVRKEFKQRKWKIVDTRYTLSEDYADIGASFTLNLEIDPPKGQLFSIGMLSSNARRRALTFFNGTVDEKTKAGVVFGQLECKKHTSGFDVQKEVESILDSYLVNTVDARDRIDWMKKIKLPLSVVDHLMMDACRGGIREKFLWSKLGLFNQEWKRLTKNSNVYPIHKDKHNAWTLLLAAGIVVKQMSPLKQMDIMRNIYDLLMKFGENLVKTREMLKNTGR